MRASSQETRTWIARRAIASCVSFLSTLAACAEPSELLPPAPPAAPQVTGPVNTKVLGETTIMATVAGPVRERHLPFYGTDLGWAFAHGDDLWVMFGDTWLTWISNELAEDADDALGKISLKDFPNGDAVERWVAAHPPPGIFAPRWHAQAPTLRITVGADGFPVPMRPQRDGKSLTSGPGLTPMGGFSNARKDDKAAAFGLFLRNEPVECAADGSCANGFECDADLGRCAPLTDLSAMCVVGTTTCDCVKSAHGMCQDRTSSVYDGNSERGRSHSVVMRQVVGNALRGNDANWPSQPWDTRRFYNLTVRTVNDFDATRSAGAGNDYRAADGVDTEREGVFVWGRPNFGGPRALGRDARLYLAWVPMPAYDETGQFAWKPQFFAGVDPEGRPRFVEREVEAAPVDLDATQPGDQPEEVRDGVGQMSISYIPSQRRWIMMYGGVGGRRLMRLIFGTDLASMEVDPLGPIYVRFAPNPWGPWSPPENLILTGNPEKGVTGQYGPGGVLFHGSCLALTCAPPELAFVGQFGEWGVLYAPAIVDPWTTERADGQVDLYWHMSTWNPYQVVLVKTRLPAPK